MKRYNPKKIPMSRDSKKWIAVFTLIAILFVCVISSLTMNIITLQSASGKITSEAQTENDESHLLAGEFDGSKMTLSLASDEVTITDNPDSVTLTATLDAEFGGYDDTVIWQLSYEDYRSEWASKKSPEECVEMVVSEDTHTVTLSVKEPFSEPIKVYAFSKESPMCDASCTLDYMKRIKQGTGLSTNVYSEDDKEYENYVRMGMDTLLAVEFELTEGTRHPDIFIRNVELTPSKEFKALINESVTDDSLQVLDSIKLNVSPWAYSSFSTATKFKIAPNLFVSGTGDLRQLNNALYKNAYNAATGEGSDFMTFTAKVTIEIVYLDTVYQIYEFSSNINLKVELGNLEFIPAVTDIVLDKDQIIF